MTYPRPGYNAMARGLCIFSFISIVQCLPSFEHTPMCINSASVK